MAMTEDFSAFFAVSEFASPATLGGTAVAGIFDNGYEEQSLGLGVAGSGPSYTLPSASVPSPVIGLALVIGSVTYKVVESMPDGTGITRLQLRT
ncbi:MAG: head-tail joining protein [Rhodoferax sp.]